MRKKILWFIIICFVFSFKQEVIFADVIYLKRGGQITGKIIAEDENSVKMKIKGGEVIFLKTQIESVEYEETQAESFYSARELYRKKLTEMDKTSARAYLELGAFALENSLADEAASAYGEAVKLDSSLKEEAEEKLNSAYSIKAQADYHRALSFYEKEDFTKAVNILEKIMDLYPRTETAEEAGVLLAKIREHFYSLKLAENAESAGMISVPEDFTSISRAIAASPEGSTIFIKSGSYREKEIILKSSLTIQGEGAGKVTLIVGEGGIKSPANKPLEGVTVKNIKIELEETPVSLKNAFGVTFERCVITGRGRGFHISESSNINIVNCTIAGMSQGIYTSSLPVGLAVRNCIIASNTEAGIVLEEREKRRGFSDIDRYTGKKLISPAKEKTEEEAVEKILKAEVYLYYNNIWGNLYNCVGIRPSSTNISEDPRFADSADYHLKPSSPCINAGDPQYKDPDGSRADMGALPYLR